MKKTLFLLVVCLMAGTLKAQEVSYGIKGGMNLTNFTGDAGDDLKVSIHFGAFLEYRVNDFLGIQPELVYSRQGTYSKSGGAKAWLRMNYINVPILARLYVTDNLSVDLGPQFGILANSKIVLKEGGTTIKMDPEELFLEMKNFDVSFAMGLTYAIDYSWSIHARYNLGLTDVEKNNSGKNSVFQLGVGYRF